MEHIGELRLSLLCICSSVWDLNQNNTFTNPWTITIVVMDNSIGICIFYDQNTFVIISFQLSTLSVINKHGDASLGRIKAGLEIWGVEERAIWQMKHVNQNVSYEKRYVIL